MKRKISLLLAVFLLLACLPWVAPPAQAAKKAAESRGIAIVFDNSGSMYYPGEKAWCRATYAMEVFASMLNQGDVLQIYPMWPIETGGKTYTMDSPLQITDVSQAKLIREIWTPDAGGTPIETIDAAAAGLKKLTADKKYLIVLTDGDTFHKGGTGMSKADTTKALDEKVNLYAGNGMAMMYLGIGEKACIPSVQQSGNFVKAHASDTAKVLSTLTDMCNQIFGRDTLPKNRISGKSIEFDISMSKLIVFVQGTDISGLKLNGNSISNPVSVQDTKYSTLGAGGRDNAQDTSLQGMIVTYEDVAAGTYTLEYTGKESSIEVYYEPNADLAFVFTDAEGCTVNPNELYEGEYLVSFGMKDAKTGQLIESDLLGKPSYQGSYSINGQSTPITADGFSGQVQIPLAMGDKFEAELTVTYLSGYKISKDSSDFGWPEGGIQVAAKPAGDLKIEVTGGEAEYSLQELEKGAPYEVRVLYQGEPLTGEALKTALTMNADGSNAKIVAEFAEDHCKLYLKYPNPDAPQDTTCGEGSFQLFATYAAQGTAESNANKSVTYNIKDDYSPLKLELVVPQDYIVIKELEQTKAITVKLTMNGAMLTAEEFAAVKLDVDCGGIKHTVTPNETDSSYTIQFKATDGITKGDYPIKVTGTFTDKIGRESRVGAESRVTLSPIPIWLKWVIGLGIALILFILIWMIMHIKMMPKNVRTDSLACMLSVGGRNVSENAEFKVRRDGKTLRVETTYGGETVGIRISELVPGQGSYLCTPNKRRSMLTRNPISGISGTGDITMVDVNGVTYQYQAATARLVPDDDQQRPYKISNGCSVAFDGKMLFEGKTKKFHADIPIVYNK